MAIDERVTQVQAGLPRLTPAQAFEAVRRGTAYIVDTRPEYQRRAAGEVPGAIVIERNHLEWRLDPASASRIPEAVSSGIRWIVLCEGGYSSSLAAESLRNSACSAAPTSPAASRRGRQPAYPSYTRRSQPGRAPRAQPADPSFGFRSRTRSKYPAHSRRRSTSANPTRSPTVAGRPCRQRFSK